MVQLIKSIETIREFLIKQICFSYIHLYEIFMTNSGMDACTEGTKSGTARRITNYRRTKKSIRPKITTGISISIM
jgi:hypothetical protein